MKPVQAALYARVSSSQQTQVQSIDSQLNALRERMHKDGLTAQAECEFIDDGWSGATLIRPALEQLRDRVALAGIDRLYVHSPDRLARKYAYQVLLLEEFQRAGVEVVFLNHAMGKTPEDDLLLQVQGMVSEYEREKIIERSRRGKRHKAKNGQVGVLSGAPYGYRYITVAEGGGCARYEVNIEQAKVVRDIFDWIGRERVTLGEVLHRLAQLGIPSPRGKTLWDRTTVWYMLKNTAYKGNAIFGKWHKVVSSPGLRPRRGQKLPPIRSDIKRPTDQWIHIPVPALIEENLFDAAQEQLVENREHARIGRNGASYLLQGLVVCRQCGYAYGGRHCSKVENDGRRSDYWYYRCNGTDAGHFGGQRVCSNTQVRTDHLDETVWQQVKSLLKDPQRLSREYNRRLEELNHVNDDATRTTLEKQLRQCDQIISRLIDVYTEGHLEKPEFESRIHCLKERKASLEQQQLKMEEALASKVELQLVIGRLEEFSEKINARLDDMGFAEQRELIRMLVKRIEIDHENINIVFRVESVPPSNDLQYCGNGASDFHRTRLESHEVRWSDPTGSTNLKPELCPCL